MGDLKRATGCWSFLNHVKLFPGNNWFQLVPINFQKHPSGSTKWITFSLNNTIHFSTGWWFRPVVRQCSIGKTGGVHCHVWARERERESERERERESRMVFFPWLSTCCKPDLKELNGHRKGIQAIFPPVNSKIHLLVSVLNLCWEKSDSKG